MAELVFANTVLSHLAPAGQLDALRVLTDDFRCLVPTEVLREVANGASQYPVLARLFDLAWLENVDLTDVHELVAFAQYKTELGGGPDKNSVEAAVLAWARVHGSIALIDDAVATRAARRHSISVRGTLCLLFKPCPAHPS